MVVYLGSVTQVFVVAVSVAAMQVYVLSRVAVGTEWYRFTINVLAFYKRPKDWSTRYSPSTLWVPAADLACRCPKLRVHKSYLIVGRTMSPSSAGIVPGPGDAADRQSAADRGRRTAAGSPRSNDQGLVLDRSGIAMRWDDAWVPRLKQFARSRQC